MKNKIIQYAIVAVLALSLLISYTYILIFASPYASTWDQVDFALALDRYDVLMMQPHFPGYPYFILGGMLIRSIVTNAATALAIFNIITMATAFIPIFLMARKYCSRIGSLCITAVIMTACYVNMNVIQPMSDGAAVAVIWWYSWSVLKAKQTDGLFWKLLPLLLFSILMGIRLSYLPFGIGILLLWHHEWQRLKGKKRIPKLLLYIVSAFIFQCIWIVGVSATEGGIVSFIKLGLAFTSGHFSDWGGAATNESSEPLFERFFVLLFINLIWIGICSKSYILLFIYCSLLFLLYLNRKQPKKEGSNWILVLLVTYFLWVLFAQNIDKPRHILPVIGLFQFYVLSKLLRSKTELITIVCTILVMLQTLFGYELLKEQRKQVPATYQLAAYLEKEAKTDSFIVYTWEEMRVMEYLQMKYPFKQVFTYDYFLSETALYEDKTIYLTDHVLRGFELQGVNTKGKVQLIASFASSELADPVYGEIKLYKWLH